MQHVKEERFELNERKNQVSDTRLPVDRPPRAGSASPAMQTTSRHLLTQKIPLYSQAIVLSTNASCTICRIAGNSVKCGNSPPLRLASAKIIIPCCASVYSDVPRLGRVFICLRKLLPDGENRIIRPWANITARGRGTPFLPTLSGVNFLDL